MMKLIQFITLITILGATAAQLLPPQDIVEALRNVVTAVTQSNAAARNNFLGSITPGTPPGDYQEYWNNSASCSEPPAYSRSADDFDYNLPQFVKNFLKYYEYGPGGSMFPAYGSLANQGNYLDNRTVYALVQAVPIGTNLWNITCGYVKGELLNPTWGAKQTTYFNTYFRAVSKSFRLLADDTVTANYYFGYNGCSDLNNFAQYHYDLKKPRTFAKYINDVAMKRQFVGQAEENLDGFIVGAPQRPSADRFATSLVSMKLAKQENCRIEFMSVLNHAFYKDTLADYLDKYFKSSLTKDQLKSKIESCVMRANACPKQ